MARSDVFDMILCWQRGLLLSCCGCWGLFFLYYKDVYHSHIDWIMRDREYIVVDDVTYIYAWGEISVLYIDIYRDILLNLAV